MNKTRFALTKFRHKRCAYEVLGNAEGKLNSDAISRIDNSPVDLLVSGMAFDTEIIDLPSKKQLTAYIESISKRNEYTDIKAEVMEFNKRNWYSKKVR